MKQLTKAILLPFWSFVSAYAVQANPAGTITQHQPGEIAPAAVQAPAEKKNASQIPAAGWPAMAEQGDHLAQGLLARACHYGTDGLQMDRTAARKWAEKAAADNHPLGHFMLGLMTLYDRRMAHDRRQKEAQPHFEAAVRAGLIRDAEKGGRQWMAMAGDALGAGMGVDEDPAKALALYRKASELGDPNACASLGIYHQCGWGVDKDVRQAVVFFRKAAEMGDAMGCLGIGECCRYGAGVAKDEGEAVRWFRKATEIGSAEGMIYLGDMLAAGRGIERDQKAAVAMFEEAAGLSNIGAMIRLGNCYMNGTGVAAAPQKSLEWFRKAEASDGLDTIFLMGQVREQGILFPKDHEEARLYYRAAAALGHQEAANALRRLDEK